MERVYIRTEVEGVVKVDTHQSLNSSLFYVPNRKTDQDEISWNDFLYTKDSATFHVEKLSGSAWQFAPTQMGIGHRIQTHEHHPPDKIELRSARWIASRSTRACSWSTATLKQME